MAIKKRYSGVLFILLILFALFVDGCGGSRTPANDTHFGTENGSVEGILGTGGGTVRVSRVGATTATSVSAAPGSLSNDSPITVEIRPALNIAEDYESVADDVRITFAFDTLLGDSAGLIVRGPIQRTALAKHIVAFVVVDGVPLAVPVTLDAQSHTFEATITREDLTTIGILGATKNTGKGISRQAGIIRWLDLRTVAVAPATRPGQAVLKRYTLEKGFQDNGALWNDGKRRCLILHGIRNNLSDMHGLAAHLLQLQDSRGTKVYQEVWGCEYVYCAGIRDTASNIADELKRRRLGDNEKKVDVYGHSMGGLVARWTIEQQGQAKNVARLFLLGTPSYGVPLPDLDVVTSTIFAKWFCEGQGMYDLLRYTSGSTPMNFQTALNDGVQPEYRDRILYFTVAGTNTHYIEFRKVGEFDDVGDLTGKYYARRFPDDIVQDGIVPRRSVHYSKLADKSSKWLDRGYQVDVPFDHKSLRDCPPTLSAIDSWVQATQLEVESWESGSGNIDLTIM